MTKYEQLIDALETIKSDECMLWPYSLDGHGYGQLTAKAIQESPVSVPRLAFFYTHGRWPQPCARHTCDTPRCFNPAHIIEGTKAENTADMMVRNRFVRPTAIITEEIVRQIRIEYAAGNVFHRELALKYGISRREVNRIVLRHRWKQVN